jgi:Uma2 family endonuclease
MTLVSHSPDSQTPFRYVEARKPVVFPESAEVPETQEHCELRVLLYQLLQDALGDQVTVGSDQFVYLDAADPRQVLAPDVYVRLQPAADLIRTWKVWERGAPDVCIEVVSESDASALAWEEKLARYRRLGTREVVRFDARDEVRPLRIWDRVEGQLLERDAGGHAARSLVLGLDWLVRPLERLSTALRIEKEGVLIPTRSEARKAERDAKEAEREARLAAEAKVRELEAALARR